MNDDVRTRGGNPSVRSAALRRDGHFSSQVEPMSMNEDSQSASEKRESKAMDLGSRNEELATVNSQLRERVEQLEHAAAQLERRELEHRVIARIGLEALRESDLQEFTREVLRSVQETLHTDYCKILELQPGQKKLLLRAGAGWKSDRVGSATEESGPGSPAGYALQSQDPVFIDDLGEERRFSVPRLFREHRITSGLSCVIRDGDHCYGVLGAFTEHSRRFTVEDAHFLQAVANALGSAIGRHQSRVRLGLQLGVAQVLADATDVNATLECLLERIVTELGSSMVGELWWPDGRSLTRRALHVAPPTERIRVERELSRRPFGLGEKALVELVSEQRRAVWITDLGHPDLFARMEGAKELGLVSGIAFPLCWGGELLGVVALFSSERLFADDTFLRSLEAIGGSIGDFIAGRESEDAMRQLAAITASSHDAILSYRDDGTITKWLAGAEKLYGYSADEMVGRSIERIVPEDRREELWTINERIRTGEVIEPFETTRIKKDGRSVMVSVRSSPIKDRKGNIVGISATDRDITRQKETERRLIEGDRQKNEFLAVLGHELRNPLTAIRSAAELLKLRGANDPCLARTQRVLERQSAHMAKLLDGLLDISRIIRGKISLEPKIVDLTGICREVVSDLTTRVCGRNLDIQSDVPSDAIWVEADPLRLWQIIDNLMSNAVKYTSDGGRVGVILSRAGDMATLKVKDTGMGIESESLPYIFEAFRQSKRSDRSDGGLGIGLALVKSLVEMQAGSVEAKSEGKGRGSEFVIRLPVTKKRPVRGPDRATDAHSLRILVIEDHQDSAELLRQVLELSGHEAVIAEDAEQGIDMAREHAPDVVLCDIGLPGGSLGYDVARALRSDPKSRDIPLIAMTGYGQPEDKARCAEAGFDSHLTKPVDVASVCRLLEKIRRGKSS